jgi:hypothetical protein
MGASTSKPYPKATILPFYATKEAIAKYAAMKETSKQLKTDSTIKPWMISDLSNPCIEVPVSVTLDVSNSGFTYDRQDFIQRVGFESNCNVTIQSRKPFLKGSVYEPNTTYRALCSRCGKLFALPAPRNIKMPSSEFMAFLATHRHDGGKSTQSKLVVATVAQTTKTTSVIVESTGRKFRTEV